MRTGFISLSVVLLAACGAPPACRNSSGLELSAAPSVPGWSCGEFQAAESAALSAFQASPDVRLHDAGALSGYAVTVIDARTVAPGVVADTGCDGEIRIDAQAAGAGSLAHEIAHVLQNCHGRSDGSPHGGWGTPGDESAGDVYPALSRLGTAWDQAHDPKP